MAAREHGGYAVRLRRGRIPSRREHDGMGTSDQIFGSEGFRLAQTRASAAHVDTGRPIRREQQRRHAGSGGPRPWRAPRTGRGYR